MKHCRSHCTLCIQVCEWEGVGGPELMRPLKNEPRTLEMVSARRKSTLVKIEIWTCPDRNFLSHFPLACCSLWLGGWGSWRCPLCMQFSQPATWLYSISRLMMGLQLVAGSHESRDNMLGESLLFLQGRVKISEKVRKENPAGHQAGEWFIDCHRLPLQHSTRLFLLRMAILALNYSLMLLFTFVFYWILAVLLFWMLLLSVQHRANFLPIETNKEPWTMTYLTSI